MVDNGRVLEAMRSAFLKSLCIFCERDTMAISQCGKRSWKNVVGDDIAKRLSPVTLRRSRSKL